MGLWAENVGKRLEFSLREYFYREGCVGGRGPFTVQFTGHSQWVRSAGFLFSLKNSLIQVPPLHLYMGLTSVLIYIYIYAYCQ